MSNETTESNVVEIGTVFEETTVTDTPDANPEYHPVLEAWKAILDSADAAAAIKPTPDWCAVIIGKWPFISFPEMIDVHDHYFRILADVRRVLDFAVETNPTALLAANAQEDATENKPIYVQLLKDWQRALLVEQAEWDCTHTDAAARLVALGEVQGQLLGRDGLASYLGVIGMEYTEDEQNDMDQELIEFRKSLEG